MVKLITDINKEEEMINKLLLVMFLLLTVMQFNVCLTNEPNVLDLMLLMVHTLNLGFSINRVI